MQTAECSIEITVVNTVVNVKSYSVQSGRRIIASARNKAPRGVEEKVSLSPPE